MNNKQMDVKLQPIDIQLTELERQLKIKIQKAKNYMVHLKSVQQDDNNITTTVPSNELTFPQFDNQINYIKQFWNVFLKNQIILIMIKEINEQKTYLNSFIQQIQEIQETYMRLVKGRNRKKNRRLAVQIQKKYTCPYGDCHKIYGSDVSLNLHIKLKHNGGNKTDRQKLAVSLFLSQLQICQAETNNLPIPKLTLNFPPGYLQAFHIYYRQNKKFSQEDLDF